MITRFPPSVYSTGGVGAFKAPFAPLVLLAPRVAPLEAVELVVRMDLIDFSDVAGETERMVDEFELILRLDPRARNSCGLSGGGAGIGREITSRFGGDPELW